MCNVCTLLYLNTKCIFNLFVCLFAGKHVDNILGSVSQKIVDRHNNAAPIIRNVACNFMKQVGYKKRRKYVKKVDDGGVTKKVDDGGVAKPGKKDTTAKESGGLDKNKSKKKKKRKASADTESMVNSVDSVLAEVDSSEIDPPGLVLDCVNVKSTQPEVILFEHMGLDDGVSFSDGNTNVARDRDSPVDMGQVAWTSQSGNTDYILFDDDDDDPGIKKQRLSDVTL